MLAATYSISELCRTLGVSRSGYYAWRGRSPGPRARENGLLRGQLRELFAAHRQVYGSPRLTACLRRQGWTCSRQRVARQMRALGLRARQKRSFRPRTTDSRHDHPLAPNRLAEGGPPSGPDQVCVSDITYIHTDQGWVYLAGVMDLYSRRIVGWACAEEMKTALVAQAIEQAIATRRPGPGLVHHSDRGCQYASGEYRGILRGIKSLASMSAAGNCYDNAAMESFWSTLKTEWLHRQTFRTRAAAELAVFDYIETFYNPKRLHSALGFQSPVEFERNRTLC